MEPNNAGKLTSCFENHINVETVFSDSVFAFFFLNSDLRCAPLPTVLTVCAILGLIFYGRFITSATVSNVRRVLSG